MSAKRLAQARPGGDEENVSKALEAKSAQESILLAEDQVAALEKAKLEKEAHSEIETEHPGYLWSQDTFYVGTSKGIGRIYQQTFIDTYSRFADAKLYDRNNALTLTGKPPFQLSVLPADKILELSKTELCQRLVRLVL